MQAIDLLNRAVARDPSFLDAYCQLALFHDQLYFDGIDRTPARLAMAKDAIDSAFRLKPDSGEAHFAQAVHLYRGYGDYDGALAELEVARQTLPNKARIFQMMGIIQRRQGHWEDSRRNLERAAELDPRDLETLGTLSSDYARFRRYAEAKGWLTRALAVAEPDDVLMKLALPSWELDVNANTRPLHEAIDSLRATNPAAVRSATAENWLFCALAERDGAAATQALSALGDKEIRIVDQVQFNRAFVEGLIARMTNGICRRPDRTHDQRRAESAVGIYRCARGAGENRRGPAGFRPVVVRAGFDRCRPRPERGSAARRPPRTGAFTSGERCTRRPVPHQILCGDRSVGWRKGSRLRTACHRRPSAQQRELW